MPCWGSATRTWVVASGSIASQPQGLLSGCHLRPGRHAKIRNRLPPPPPPRPRRLLTFDHMSWWQAFFARGTVYLQGGDLPEAEQDLKEAWRLRDKMPKSDEEVHR